MPVRLKKQILPDTEMLANEVCLEWHVWESQLQPYTDLESGDHVIMVSGKPGSGMLTWEVEVVSVARDRCDDVDAAWRLLEPLATRAGVAEDQFRADPFTDRLTRGRRYVLGWTYRLVREIMQPRIRGEHDLLRHGWRTIDVLRIGSSGNSAAAGQRQLQDAILRGKIEAAAMGMVHACLVRDGWAVDDIHDTSTNSPYDYEIGPESDPYLVSR
ncbi:hypothetical protein GCM10023322_38150 [Rugosimonospora acidiphila]|uniref:Uncharacterized protein n=1 Tax=Rugosimonospora acidiphila TaxID=556531 RepID=A0ABP9RVT8_9ACTN